ncbi:RND efflux system, outer membrane lipoprotein, NodT [Candidatus Koribacter versatilis Ellin345]|uniref:RND efflux system, outer membrane lipoprotein, NodT n=1 Tax=Koribacter versatilis (strain Ellin345) TaxID=204669 RepID=Q1IJ78_KORVE|nr:efflux transporter outer membrane subunit [Candidatus Koribacter versatilis]ABF43072.1 RND efflux system, outer membrane lipoprotein, NodT [Candidatus Koribacter versatilis Ellin345]
MNCKRILLALLLLLMAGCKVGPNYKRPAVTVPDAYRGPTLDGGQANGISLGEQKWWDVFNDEQLQKLIRQALDANYDVKIAATRVLQAQAALGITRADQFPTIAGGASALNERIPRVKGLPAYENSALQVNLSLVWQLDFWGKYRRATEAARADLLSTEWGKRAVINSVISNVANGYFQLLELDREMEIAKGTLASRQESLRLVNIRQKGGTTSLLDVRQSEQLLYTAAAAIPDLERRIEQEENFISILLGQNPGPIQRGKPLVEFAILPSVPPGLPSTLLERRPDLQSAEQQLVAANARIGVAKADYFPQISLTALGGYQSSALTGLFSGPAGLWSFGGQLAQPIFTGGKIRSNVRLTEAQQQEAVFRYQQSIQQAFREVSDSLVAYRKNQEFREQEANLAASAVDATRLARIRYEGGVSSYLEVLDNDTRSFDAEISLAQAQLGERVALVQLYNALGGGWQQ